VRRRDLSVLGVETLDVSIAEIVAEHEDDVGFVRRRRDEREAAHEKSGQDEAGKGRHEFEP